MEKPHYIIHFTEEEKAAIKERAEKHRAEMEKRREERLSAYRAEADKRLQEIKKLREGWAGSKGENSPEKNEKTEKTEA